MKEMNYNEFKNGDVIVIKYFDEERIVIFDRIEKNIYDIFKLNTYAELADNDLFLEKDEPGYSYLLDEDIYSCRFATEEEKNKLYNEICKYYTEEYDTSWFKYFTDSTYFEIRDFLLDVFCIKVEEYDDDLLYPDFVNEIHKFIWDELCAKTETNYKYVKSDVAMVNKSEFIAKLKRWLELETNWNMQYIESGKNPNFGKIDELINYMEEI
jgi:hypothetical protein